MKYAKFIYWFIHNKIVVPVLIDGIIIAIVAFSPFYIIWNYLKKLTLKKWNKTK